MNDQCPLSDEQIDAAVAQGLDAAARECNIEHAMYLNADVTANTKARRAIGRAVATAAVEADRRAIPEDRAALAETVRRLASEYGMARGDQVLMVWHGERHRMIWRQLLAAIDRLAASTPPSTVPEVASSPAGPTQEDLRRLDQTLTMCAEKLLMYYARSNEYVGGVEHSVLQGWITDGRALITKALGAKGKP